MVDSAETPKSGGEQTSKDAEQALQQPKDAVKMTNLSQSGEGEEEPPVPAKDEPVAAASTATQTAEPTVASTDAADVTIESSKGKGKAEPSPAKGEQEPDTEPAEDPASPVSSDTIVCRLTLIIVSTGGKWNFRVDTKYLEKREIEIPEMRPDGRPDPFSINFKTLKQLLLRDWRPEWGVKPPDSQYMKLISYGKVLEDNWRLIDAKFSELSENPVHVSVTPIDMIHEEEAEGKNPRDKASTGGRNRERGETGCCIIL